MRAATMRARANGSRIPAMKQGSPTSISSRFSAPARSSATRRNSGRNPHWRGDGKELFYLDAAGTMMAVPIDLTTGSAAGLPKALFSAGLVSNNNMYAVTKDGQRFLVNKNAAVATPLTVIVNWPSTLQK